MYIESVKECYGYLFYGVVIVPGCSMHFNWSVASHGRSLVPAGALKLMALVEIANKIRSLARGIYIHLRVRPHELARKAQIKSTL